MPSLTTAPVPGGPRAYRARLRALGPVVGLLLPGLAGIVALRLLDGTTSTARGIGGFVLAVMAAPALLVLGAPLNTGSAVYLPAVLLSALVWLALGVVASRRATRTPVASWRDFWREYLWLAAGIWVGVIGALVAANLILGRALF